MELALTLWVSGLGAWSEKVSGLERHNDRGSQRRDRWPFGFGIRWETKVAERLRGDWANRDAQNADRQDDARAFK